MESEAVALRQPRDLKTLVPYLVIGFACFAFLMVASRVRTNEMVFLWVMTQGLLKNKLGLPVGYWSSAALFLIGYLLIGFLAWWIIERRHRDPRLVWRRAIFAWICVWATYALVATLLVQGGVLYE